MRKNFGATIGAFGAILMIVSIVFEYARAVPSYRFIVEPWSMRGFEMVHGWVALAIGVGLLVATLLAAPESAASPSRAPWITVAIAAIGAVLGLAFIRESYSVDFDGGAGLVIALILGIGITAVTSALLKDRSRLMSSQLVSFGMFLVIGAILAFLIFPVLGEVTITGGLWITILVALIAAVSLIVRPVALGPYRMLINSSVLAAMAHILSAGAIRSTLFGEQLETLGVSGQYKDLQVTSGWMLGVAGAVLAFVGAVSLWAKRRDQIKTRERAEKQREAAQKSAAEISAAQAS
ncbi:MAG: hypothetical protein KJN71_08495 [Acidimicrobiia bacterium]|nr:hypothetical protein [Acidimicrobiia bacterium]